jgi:hypothetical protein
LSDVAHGGDADRCWSQKKQKSAAVQTIAGGWAKGISKKNESLSAGLFAHHLCWIRLELPAMIALSTLVLNRNPAHLPII